LAGCSTAEGLSVVSEEEVLVMFVILDSADPERNISQRNKIE